MTGRETRWENEKTTAVLLFGGFLLHAHRLPSTSTCTVDHHSNFKIKKTKKKNSVYLHFQSRFAPHSFVPNYCHIWAKKTCLWWLSHPLVPTKPLKMLLHFWSFLTQTSTLQLINLSHFLNMHEGNSHTQTISTDLVKPRSGLPCSCRCFFGLILSVPRLKAKTQGADIWHKPQFSSSVGKRCLVFIFHQGGQHPGWLYLKSTVAAVQVLLHLTVILDFFVLLQVSSPPRKRGWWRWERFEVSPPPPSGATHAGFAV